MAEVTFRPYQDIACDEITEAIFDELMGDFVYQMATGSGKSLVIAEIARRMLYRNPRSNIVMLAPTKELIVQNLGKLRNYFPEEWIGVMCSGVKRFDTKKMLTLASIKTLENHPLDRIPDLIIVDECYSQDTEVLTSKGWIKFPDLTMQHELAQFSTDSELLTWTKPSRLVDREYCGEMINLKSERGTDLLVTPNHDVLTKSSLGKYKKSKASEVKLGSTQGILRGDSLTCDFKVKKEIHQYDGRVYCATVPDGNLVVRRNGKISVCGNCHLISTKNTGQYRKYIAFCKAHNPKCKVVGLTATAYTPTGIWLSAGKDPLFHHIMINPACQLKSLVEKGWLCPLRQVEIPLEQKILSGDMKKSAATGDYKVGESEATFNPHLEDRVEKTVQYANQLGVRKCMCVTSSIAHCERVAARLRAMGQAVSIVHSKSKLREKNVEDFLSGVTRFIVTPVALTTGFDCEELDMIANFRHIGSKVLYVQVGGRGTRSFTNDLGQRKLFCWFLDWTNTSEDMGHIDRITGKMPRKKNGVSPVKECPNCDYVVPISTRICRGCGHEFEFEVNIKEFLKSASGAEIMSIDKDKIKTIDDWRVEKYESKTGNKALKINFIMNEKIVLTDCLFFHESGDHKKAHRLWGLLKGNMNLPPESQNAAWYRRGELKRPDAIEMELFRKNYQLSNAIYRDEKIDEKSIVIKQEIEKEN